MICGIKNKESFLKNNNKKVADKKKYTYPLLPFKILDFYLLISASVIKLCYKLSRIRLAKKKGASQCAKTRDKLNKIRFKHLI